MIEITPTLFIKEDELKFSFIRAPGPGGQNVNKVSTCVQLRFNVVHSSSLPEDLRIRLLNFLGNKVTLSGDFIIRASRFRTQLRNKQDAIRRLQAIIIQVIEPPKKRKKTKVSYASKLQRLEKKKKKAKKKSLRRIPKGDD